MNALSTTSAPSFRIGGHAAWSLHDGTFTMPLAALARGVPPAESARALAGAPLANGELELHVNVLLVRWGRELLLVDAGCGTAYGPSLGFTGERLTDLGFSADDITAVFFTHLHLDHIAGALDLAARRIRFPRARFLAARAEFDFWQQPAPDLSGTGLPPEQRIDILRHAHIALALLAPRLEFFEPDAVLFPGITALPLPGHTPFHTGFLFEQADARLLAAGDAFIDPRLHLAHPEYSPIGDTLPEIAISTRRALVDRRAREHLPLFCAHFPPPGNLA